jgi:TetR/AcrR family fatty acid metabolism transcriptional regulator
MQWTPRQEEIIEAATELIGEKGVQGLTTKRLADKMGFSQPALYRHFKGKTEILRSVLLFFKHQLGARLQNIAGSDGLGLQRIEAMMRFQFSHFSKFPAVVMVIFSETSFQHDGVLSKVVAEIIDRKRKAVVAIILEGQQDGSVRVDIEAGQLATLVMGSMRLTVLEWKLSNFSFDLEDRGAALIGSIELLLTPNKN